ncbi:Csa1 family protein [Enterococcus sp. BWM-S5]|uniref:Csa1 family protein n=1 Tax=Enterococcus larvae TaxID=2794352 RepID=A0ABS4CK72_9ENTE|nr:Csa1 family protein [Enterococcus larvae]MBP1046583.1 Csa1 family protein [Enterococcus larvae]
MTMMGGCGNQAKENAQKQLRDFTSLYPMKDLTEFYDLEGSRDEAFAEDDQGVWVISSGYSYEQDDELHSHRVTLDFNKNTRNAEGYYYYSIFGDTPGGREIKKIAIKYDHDQIVSADEQTLPEEMANYKFLIQYVELGNSFLNSLDVLDARYNEQTAICFVKYQLEKEERMLVAVEGAYRETAGETPSLLIEGDGKDGWEQHSSRHLSISFGTSNDYTVDESISFIPSSLKVTEGE